MPGLERKVLDSIIRFWFYALYLLVIFGMLALHGGRGCEGEALI
jgi:hypothetical protein